MLEDLVGNWRLHMRAKSAACASFTGYPLLIRLVLLVMTMAISPAIEAQITWAKDCASCHSGGSGPPLPFPNRHAKVLNNLDGNFRQTILNSQASPGVPNMNVDLVSPSSTDLETIRKYLLKVRDAETSGASPTISSVGVGSSTNATVSVMIKNYRRTPLKYELSVASTVSNEFTLVSQSASPLSCAGGSVPITLSESPITCTISATVKFKPGAIGTRTGSLDVALTTPSGEILPVDMPGRHIVLSAEAILPLTASLSALTFNTNVNVPNTQFVTITNHGGTSFTMTGLPLSDAAIAANYTLDTLASDRCQVQQSLAANGGFCILRTTFSPTADVISTPGATLSVAHSAFGSPNVIQLNGSTIPGPRIQLSSTSLPAVEATVGSSAAMQTVLVYNAGTTALQFSAFNLGGAAGRDFERGGTCSTGTLLQVGSINSSTSCTIELTFKPTSLGTRNATLTIVSNAINQPTVIIGVSGNGVSPAPLVDLSSSGPLDFGLQTVAGIYPARSVRLTNAGTAPLSIAGLVVEGAAFANSANPCPATLAIRASCTINITFTPTAAEISYAGTLRVISNAAGSPHSVVLAGRGTAAAIPILEWTSPALTRLDFGPVSAGTVSATQSVTFVNRGPGGVNLSVINAIGLDAAAFSVSTSGCSVTVPLFQDIPCRVDIIFAPGSSGSKSAALQIISSGSAPATLTLTGTGLGNPATGLALSATAMTFDAIRVGAQSAPAELTLSGTGAGAVNITGLQISGPYVLQSKTCATAPFSLAAGSSCTMTVTFEPNSEGSAAGMLRVTNDATPAVREIALNGTGQAKADVSGGGCSIASGDTLADPILGALVLLAIAALAHRRRTRTLQRKRS